MSLDRRTGDTSLVTTSLELNFSSTAFYHMDINRQEVYMHASSKQYGFGVHAISIRDGNVNAFYPQLPADISYVGISSKKNATIGFSYKSQSVFIYSFDNTTRVLDTLMEVTGITNLLNNVIYEPSIHSIFLQGDNAQRQNVLIEAELSTKTEHRHFISDEFNRLVNIRYNPATHSIVGLNYDSELQNQHVVQFNLSTGNGSRSRPLNGIKWIANFNTAIDTANEEFIFVGSSLFGPACHRLYSFDLTTENIVSGPRVSTNAMGYLFSPPPRMPVFARDQFGNIDSSIFELQCTITNESDSIAVIDAPCFFGTSSAQASFSVPFVPKEAHATLPTQGFNHVGNEVEWVLFDSLLNRHNLFVTYPYQSVGVYEVDLETTFNGTSYFFKDTIVVDDLPASSHQAVINRQNLQVFPNPAQDHFLISAKEGEIEQIEIFTRAGKKVYSANQDLSSPVDISELAPGVYFLRVQFLNLETQTTPLLKF